MPRISVILPTRNRCELLKRAVASVIGQTFKDLELIIINDGSTDATAAYLSTLNDARIHSLNLVKNRGGGAARNEGLRRAGGEYIAFLDDDDAWENSKLEEQLSALQAKNADLCRTGINVYTMHGTFLRYVFRQPPYSDPMQAIMYDNYLGTTSSVMVKKTFVEKIDGFDENLPALQDWDFYIRLFKQGCAAHGIDKPLVRYYYMDKSNNVSFDFVNHKAASDRMVAKFAGDHHVRLLKKGLRFITLKKMLKSRHFFISFITCRFGRPVTSAKS